MRQSSTSFWGRDIARSQSTLRESKIDWFTVILLFGMAVLGWFNLYSTTQEDGPGFLNLTTLHGKEAFFLLFSFALGAFVLYLDTKFMEFISYIVYGITLVLLVAVLTVSAVKGASSWFEFGGFKLQPTEFAKLATLMALSKFMSRYNFNLKNMADVMTCLAIVAVPMVLVLLQNDAGSALVFMGLILVFYREGMHPIFLIGLLLVGINGVLSVLFSTVESFKFIIIPVYVVLGVLSFFYIFRRRFLTLHIVGVLFLCSIPFVAQKVLQPHQSARMRVLVASEEQIRSDKDLKAVHYNLRESLVAIGSGGLTGKGYGNSTHTRGDFVPEEHTDYIFCVVGEEHGFVGSVLVLILFFLLLWRLIHMAENAKSRYALVFGYGMAAVYFMHVFVNVGMTLGLLPTVGIPLPFFSYGGSSTISFTLMAFVLLNHYSYRTNILT